MRAVRAAILGELPVRHGIKESPFGMTGIGRIQAPPSAGQGRVVAIHAGIQRSHQSAVGGDAQILHFGRPDGRNAGFDAAAHCGALAGAGFPLNRLD